MKINRTPLAVVGLVMTTAVVTFSLAVFPANAGGPWYVATTGDDANDCLSPATACATINGALNKPGFVTGDTVLVASGTYTGTGNEVVLLNKDATLSGGWDATFTSQGGMSTIDGQGSRIGVGVQLFVTATVDHFVVQNAVAVGGGDAGGISTRSFAQLTVTNSVIRDNQGFRGGGILILNGRLTVIDSAITGNLGEVGGGGIYVSGSVAEVRGSDVSGNTAGKAGFAGGSGGGGIENFNGTLTVDSSTISNNALLGRFSGSGIQALGTVTILNSTVSGNIGGNFGEGVFSFSSTVNITNSTIAGNESNGIVSLNGTYNLQSSILADSGVQDCFDDPSFPSGTIVSAGRNLVETPSNCVLDATDVTSLDPKLGPLQDNGGPTLTHALLPSSPAIDAVPVADCTLATDQRGVARPQGAACDIGAFELDVIQVVQVTIDIKPGSDTNPINPKSKGAIPVAILTTDDFDATTVDPLSVQFGPDGALKAHGNGHIEDADDDGDVDLVLHFKAQETGIQCGDTEASLAGETFAGQMIGGTDSINTVGCE